ncbi:MAG: galactose-1-phosphate uridylyltransferase, partial [Acidimicrobiales bacterium]|nr:galactose-1-phosphate uridylyltransferase [Acidimicrobiales bacterium]
MSGIRADYDSDHEGDRPTDKPTTTRPDNTEPAHHQHSPHQTATTRPDNTEPTHHREHPSNGSNARTVRGTADHTWPPPYRVDPLTGDVAYIVAKRQKRPNLPQSGCPFCPSGLEAPEPYEVRWFENRWPAMPDARCEVILYTPQHDATFASLGQHGARRVVDLWADRTRALGERDDVAYVLIFENRGPEVGATIAHPHGQIYAYDRIPPRALQELEHGDTATALGPGPYGAAAERLVSRRGRWQAWTTWAPVWPYELLVATTDPVPDLLALDDRDRDDLAGILVDVLGRLDRLFAEPMPYMLWIHQRPFTGEQWPNAWLHIHITPYYRAPRTPRFVAGA